jgi:hypothetical protein
MALMQVNSPPLAGPRSGKAIAIAIIVALAAWPLAYAAGIFPWLGYAWLSRSSIEVGPKHFILGEDKAGTSFGLNTFLFFKGQTIVISYDADIRRGCLWMQIFHLGHQGPDSSVFRCATESGRGEWRVPVAQTGIYDLIIHPSVVKGPGPGWEISYTAWWGAQW